MEITLKRLTKKGKFAKEVVSLTQKKSYVFGRQPNNVELNSRTMPESHCIFHHNTKGLLVEVLENPNGVAINGTERPAGSMIRLNHNDLIDIGKIFKYKVQFKSKIGMNKDTNAENNPKLISQNVRIIPERQVSDFINEKLRNSNNSWKPGDFNSITNVDSLAKRGQEIDLECQIIDYPSSELQQKSERSRLTIGAVNLEIPAEIQVEEIGDVPEDADLDMICQNLDSDMEITIDEPDDKSLLLPHLNPDNDTVFLDLTESADEEDLPIRVNRLVRRNRIPKRQGIIQQSEGVFFNSNKDGVTFSEAETEPEDSSESSSEMDFFLQNLDEEPVIINDEEDRTESYFKQLDNSRNLRSKFDKNKSPKSREPGQKSQSSDQQLLKNAFVHLDNCFENGHQRSKFKEARIVLERIDNYENTRANKVNLGALPEGKEKRKEERKNEKAYHPNTFCPKCRKQFITRHNLKRHIHIYNGVKFPCRICHLGLSRRSYAKRQELMHRKERPFSCGECSKAYLTQGDLDQHMHMHNELRQFLCDICGKRFNRKLDVRLHMRVHSHDRKLLECGVCKKKLADKNSLTTHMSLHTGEKKFQCDLCNKTFLRRLCLTPHLRNHGEKQFPCPKCDKVYLHQSVLNSHMKLVHTKEGLLYCQECGEGFISRVALKIHFRKHTGERPFVCDICDKTFTRKDTLKCHKRTHMPKHFCNECGDCFYHKHDLLKHIRTHFPKEILKCPKCGLVCPGHSQLRNHLLTHTNIKPFTCAVCDKKLRYKSSLTEHMFMHTGDYPFKCYECGKGFGNKKSIKVHMRIHTGEKPYSCRICPRKFHNAASWRIHMRTHGSGAWKCQICGIRFIMIDKETHYEAHRKEHRERENRGEKFSCLFCNKNFENQKDLVNHCRQTISSAGKCPVE